MCNNYQILFVQLKAAKLTLGTGETSEEMHFDVVTILKYHL